MPNLGEIYQRSVLEGKAIRNPVIVIPGMMGSKLKHLAANRTIWGVFNDSSIDPNVAEDIRLMACPIEGENLDEFDDGVYASGVLDSVTVSYTHLTLPTIYSV